MINSMKIISRCLLIVYLSMFLSCSESEQDSRDSDLADSSILKVDSSNIKATDEAKLTTRNYYFDRSLEINGLPVTLEFNLESIKSRLGEPDSVILGGPQIVKEFGFDDYWLFYGDDFIDAGHGYVMGAQINSSRININGLKVGMSINEVQQILGISLELEKEIIVRTINEDALTLEFKGSYTKILTQTRINCLVI